MASLHVPVWAWAAVVAGLAVLLGADLLASLRRTGPPRLAEAAWWTLATVILAVAFGALLATTAGGTAAGQFFAGWLTEYSLSLDNLLVFAILIGRSGMPDRLQGRVVLGGVGLAVVLRGMVIALGAAALHRFGWLEYLFGAFLLYTAAQVARRGAAPSGGPAARGTPAGGPAASPGTPAAHRGGPAATGACPAAATQAAHSGGTAPRAAGSADTDRRGGLAGRLAARLTRRPGRTGVLLLVIALGVTDVMFALDSIPAVFGLTRDPFLVFSANVFALLGLRHLYFLVAGLLSRLKYLQAGLCVILSFIGIKLIGEALRESGVTRIGPVPVPVVGTWLSLAIIVTVLAVTALASTMATRQAAVRQHRRQREPADRTACGEQH